MYKVLIVGCGKIAGYFSNRDADKERSRHAWVFKSHEYFQVAGCVDVDLARAKRFSDTVGIPYFGDNVGDAVTSLHPDVVVVATPDETHFEVVCEALQQRDVRPRIVFLEKPVCTDQSQLEQLLSISDETGVPILVNQSRRFDPAYHELRAQVRKGELGELVQVDAVYYGGWRHNAVHWVDIIRYVTDLEFRDFEILETIDDGRLADPTLTVRGNLGGDKEIPVWFHGWDERIYQIFDLELRFSKGRLRIGNFENDISWEKAQVNSLGERVLQQEALESWRNEPSPLSNAVAGMYHYLQTGETKHIRQCLLPEIAPSMRTIWTVGKVRDT